MVIVLLHHLSTPRVILQDLLVCHTSQELVRSIRVDADDVRCLARGELVQTFASLGIPNLHIAVVAGRDELCTSRVEIDIVNGLCVARVCSQQFSLMVDVPNSDLGICRCRKKQMTAVRHESYLRYRFGMVFVGV